MATSNYVRGNSKNFEYIIDNKVRHDELLIMKNDWESICRKIDEIDIREQIGFGKMLLGAIISYSLATICSILNSLRNNNTFEKSFEESVPSLIIIILAMALEIVILHFSKTKIKNNAIYLKEIKHEIDAINSRQCDQQSSQLGWHL